MSAEVPYSPGVSAGEESRHTKLRHDRHAVALLGNPNTGKSTLFSALTGARQKVANFPGVTVEAKLGRYEFENSQVTVIDLPGSYSLAARSPDERVATEALLGRVESTPRPDGVIVVLDASSLERNLYLATQVLEFGLPTVVALTMVDIAEARGVTIDTARLSECLGVPVVAVNAARRKGIDQLKHILHQTLHREARPLAMDWPVDFRRGVDTLHERLSGLGVKLGFTPSRPEALRLLVDASGPFFDEVEEAGGQAFVEDLQKIRAQAGAGKTLAMVEAQVRYGAINHWVKASRKAEVRDGPTWTDRIDNVLTHKLWGTLFFVLLMGLVFQSIYSWSGPLMDLIDAGFGALGDEVGSRLPEGALRSLVVDGAIAGVGGILIFLPQILILFLFIAILEDVGYMSRAAFLMDRLMARFGLSGRSFIPLLSSFACNVPGVMGARVIGDRNTRLTTIFLAPFMSCSARLPVYTLMIGAFVPQHTWFGFVELQALVLFAMYTVGILAAIPTALILKKGILKGRVTPFLLELPTYKWPRPGNVLRVLWDRGGSFVARAGTVILAASVVVWALGYFPRNDETIERYQQQREAEQTRVAKKLDEIAAGVEPGLTGEGLAEHREVGSALADLRALRETHEAELARIEEEVGEDENEAANARADEALAASLIELHRRHGGAFETAKTVLEVEDASAERLAEIDNDEAGELMRDSLLGRMGRVIEPTVEPLGWDWRIGMAAIASFPAREVVIASLGTIFNLGSEQDEESDTLKDVLHRARREDGTPLFTLATGLSIMVFFALCAQCAATLAVMRRETNSWRWPLASFAYMTALAWLASAVVYQVAAALGG